MNKDWKDILGGLEVPSGNDDAAPVTEPAAQKPATRNVTLFYEAKGRAGKPATILADIKGLTDSEIADLASDLKKKLGTGGSARGGEILVQGDRREELRRLLRDRGFKVKG